MKLQNLKKYLFVNLLSLFTIIFVSGLIFSCFTLADYLIKTGGVFDPIADTYPGLITYEYIIFKCFVVYFVFLIIFVICAFKENAWRKENKIPKKLLNLTNQNNPIYNFFFWLGLFLVSAPIWGAALVLVIFFISELLPPY